MLRYWRLEGKNKTLFLALVLVFELELVEGRFFLNEI